MTDRDAEFTPPAASDATELSAARKDGQAPARRFGIAGKIALWAAVFGAATALGVGALMYQSSYEAVREMDELATAEALERATVRLLASMDRLRQDTVILSTMPPIQGLVRSDKNGGIDPLDGSTEQLWEERLADIFATFLNARPEYFQIRFVSAAGEGIEIVRVDKGNEGTQRTPDDLLQPKSRRPYFKKARELAQGQVFLSEVDLNREHGHLEIPHRPTIRAATPVFSDESGEVFGMIVINANAQAYFSRIAAVLQSGQSLVVANTAGDYLYHSDRAKTFGFDLGERYLVQDEFPALSDVKDPAFTGVVTGREGAEHLYLKRVALDQGQPGRFLSIGVISADRPLGNQIGADSAWIIIAAVTFILGGTLLAVIGSRVLTRSLKEVTAAATSLGRGQRDVDLSHIRNRKDETGDLAKAFGAMADEISVREAEMRTQADALATSNNQLTQLNTQLSSVMETALDGLIVIDEAGIVQSFNPSAESMFGYKKEEVIGENVRMLMPEPYHAEHDGYIRNYVETGNSKIIGIGREVSARRKDGSVFPIELGISPMRVGEKRLFLGMTSDLSRKKAIERQKEERFIAKLQQSNKELTEARAEAEEATAAKSDFLANMTHELRTPLNSIVGFAGLLAKSSKLNDKDRRFANIIDGSSQSLLALVNDILDFSSLEAGAVALHPVAFSLPKLVGDVAASVSLMADERGLTIKVEKGNTVSEAHFGDPVRLHQVLLNLVNNALKFTSKGGITIAVSAAEHSDSVQHLRVEVRDTGIGIPPDKVQTIFQRFAQADKTIHSRFGGTGLGLAISKRLVQLMGGKIGIESAQGKGTTVWIDVDLPSMAAEALADDGSDDALASKTASKRILVVDDVDLNRDLVMALLAPHGHTVTEAEGGAAAVEAVKSADYDIVLMDVQMPGMNGLEATRAIRSIEGCETLPIVAMTAQALTSQWEACREAGMTAHLPKPITPASLFAMLVKWAGDADESSKLLTYSDQEVSGEIRDEFLSHCAQELARVRLLLNSSSPSAFEELRRLAHRVSGTAAMVGLVDLSEEAAALEDALANDKPAHDAESEEFLTRMEQLIEAA